jgi:hypothetical protein
MAYMSKSGLDLTDSVKSGRGFFLLKEAIDKRSVSMQCTFCNVVYGISLEYATFQP